MAHLVPRHARVPLSPLASVGVGPRPRPGSGGGSAVLVLCVVLVGGLCQTRQASAQEPPTLTAPVNDFAGVIDASSARTLDARIRSLQAGSGDVVVVATVETFAPYADIREFAVKMFENGGRGIGVRGRDNGLLVVLAVRDRQVWVEVGYDLESFITDGFAGEVSRETMIPEFRSGGYGAGLLAGVTRIVGRIASGRNVTLQGVPREVARRAPGGQMGPGLVLLLFIAMIVLNAISGRLRGGRGSRASRWHSGVGPFGGGFGGGGGGFGGGFGGFGGGRSGGGGGGGGW